MNKVIPFLLIFFFITSSIVTAFNPVSASEVVEDSWNTKTPMPFRRYGFGVATVDGKIYAIGGYTGEKGHFFPPLNNGKFVAINERYDPEADTWMTVKSMPTPKSDFAIATWQGKIYCIGGVTHDPGELAYSPSYRLFMVNYLRVTEVYDPVTDSWSTKAPLPSDCGINLQAYVLDDKIFVIDHNNVLFMYDPVADVWITKTTLTLAPVHVSTVVDDKLIFIGLVMSKNSGQFQMNVRLYNPKTDEWNEGTSGPTITEFSSAVMTTMGVYAPQLVYVLGRQYDTTNLNNWSYDPVNDTWATAKPPFADISDCTVAVIDDLLYVIGNAVNEQYVPIGYGTLSPNTSKPEPSKPYLNYLIVVTLAITIGIIVTALFLFKVRKREILATSPV